VRQQMIKEMKVADEEARQARLKERLNHELIAREFKKQQRRAFMPMHRNPPDFVEINHNRSHFLKDPDLTNDKGVLPEGRLFIQKADPALL